MSRFNLMNYPDDADRRPPRRPGGDPANLLYLAACGHATCLLVFLRCRFGTAAFQRNGLAALAIIIIYGCLTNDYVMWPFYLTWQVVFVVRQIGARRAWLKGLTEHSRYGGWPWAAMLVPGVRKEMTAKTAVEPLLCLLLAVPVFPLSPHLGFFILLGLFSLPLKAAIERSVLQARVRALKDAEIENRQLMDAYRGSRDLL